jgi:hypothetical protein
MAFNRFIRLNLSLARKNTILCIFFITPNLLYAAVLITVTQDDNIAVAGTAFTFHFPL